VVFHDLKDGEGFLPPWLHSECLKVFYERPSGIGIVGSVGVDLGRALVRDGDVHSDNPEQEDISSSSILWTTAMEIPGDGTITIFRLLSPFPSCIPPFHQSNTPSSSADHPHHPQPRPAQNQQSTPRLAATTQEYIPRPQQQKGPFQPDTALFQQRSSPLNHRTTP
jgi:hypothetical protein